MGYNQSFVHPPSQQILIEKFQLHLINHFLKPKPTNMRGKKLYLLFALIVFSCPLLAQKKKTNSNTKTEALKQEVIKSLDAQGKTVQEMVDMVFSFAELGFQETETSTYLTNILEKNGLP